MAVLIYNGPAIALGLVVIVTVVLPLVVVGNLIYRLFSDPGLPAHLPWAGVPEGGGRWAKAKATLSSFLHAKDLLNEGYAKYSKKGQAYVLPQLLTGPEVILPMTQLRWLLDQPDTVLSQQEVNREFLEADHTFMHQNVVREPVHPQLIRRELTNKLGSFAEDIVDELHASLADNWGDEDDAEDQDGDGGWREVHVYNTMLDVISRLSTRVLVCRELCRNQEFLTAARSFDRNVVVSAAMINILPSWLKPIAAPFVLAYDYLQYARMAKYTIPMIKERLASQPNPDEKLPMYDRETPNDYVQWAIAHARAHPDPAELSPRVMAIRLAALCFAAIQSSVISLTNALFDLAASPDCEAIMAGMREEVERELAAAAVSGGARHTKTEPAPVEKVRTSWTKALVARLHRVDSTLRESMRLNGFVARGPTKMVVVPEGVLLPDGTTRIPCGTKIGVSAYNVQHDEDVYKDAARFDAFRFVSPVRDADGASRTRESPQALVTTSPTFLAFSHGQWACPGRFFAANQLKLALAHIALLYDIEPIPTRPESKWFFGSMAPPMWSTLRVRRRRSPKTATVTSGACIATS